MGAFQEYMYANKIVLLINKAVHTGNVIKL